MEDPICPPSGSMSVSQLLTCARCHITRLSPTRALSYLQRSPLAITPSTRSINAPSVLVDIRPAAQRAAEGEVEGALIVERNVLEWRFDPRSEARLPIADRYDLRIILLCQEGYASSLAARGLQELGLWNATDVVGGFRAWKEEGLPLSIEAVNGQGGSGGSSGSSEAGSKDVRGKGDWSSPKP